MGRQIVLTALDHHAVTLRMSPQGLPCLHFYHVPEWALLNVNDIAGVVGELQWRNSKSGAWASHRVKIRSSVIPPKNPEVVPWQVTMSLLMSAQQAQALYPVMSTSTDLQLVVELEGWLSLVDLQEEREELSEVLGSWPDEADPPEGEAV